MNLTYKAHWKPTALCGCEIKIDASWGHEASLDDAGNTVQYAFPVPNSITAMELVVACPTHEHFLTDALPDDPYRNKEDGGDRGYLKVTGNETPVEKLFIQHYVHSAVIQHFNTCDCEVFAFIPDRFNMQNREVKEHDYYTFKCEHHPTDMLGKEAFADNALFNGAVQAIMENSPELVQEYIEIDGKKIVLTEESRAKLPAEATAEPRKELINCSVVFDEERNIVVSVPQEKMESVEALMVADSQVDDSRVTVQATE